MTRHWRLLLLVGILSAALVRVPAQENPPSPNLKALSCADCHGNPLHDFLSTRHAAAFSAQGRRTEEEICGPCHGEVAKHDGADKPKEVPVQNRFKDPKTYDPAAADRLCLACHAAGDRALPEDGRHLDQGLHCLNCHTGMGRGGIPHLLIRRERDLCGACHSQALAPFRSGHRTDRSEALCTFCHDPHARLKPLLARECVSCHRNYAYPKPFEHPPVEDGCLACHDPHGSGERFLLRDARPALCLSCHSQLESFHRVDQAGSVFRLYEACQNCHPRIHGSDAPGGYRFQR